MKKMKKAQISMFVIIGLILLLAAGLFFYLTSELTKDKPVVDIPDVSVETRPAQKFIQSCLESTAELAIRRVAAQGGYIEYARPNMYDTSLGDAVVMEPDVVPFWRYIDEDCTAQFGCPASAKPPLCKLTSADRCAGLPSSSTGSIESAIENYILEHLDECLNDLASVSDFYDVELSDERELEIFFGADSTSFILTNPLTTTSRSTSNQKSEETYRAVLDVDMIQLYTIASDTLTYIEGTNYYEHQTLNMISVFSCMESSCLPPMEGFSTALNENTIWTQYQTKTRLETEILPMMSLVKYINFDNYKLFTLPDGEDYGDFNPYIEGLYSSFSKSKSSETLYTGYDLNHQYLYSPIKFQIDSGKEIITGKPIDMSKLGVVNHLPHLI